MAGGYSHVKTDAFMSAAKYVAARMKVPVSGQPGPCSHQRGFFHSPWASPTMCAVPATVSSTDRTGSPPGHSPPGASANMVARLITSAGESSGTPDPRDETPADYVVSHATP